MKRPILFLTLLMMFVSWSSVINSAYASYTSNYVQGGGGQLGSGGVAINETNFPDANFRKVVNTYDTNKDGTLSESEAKSVTELNIYNKGITSLKGVEYFTALTELWCFNSNLTAPDVSKNTALTTLQCNPQIVSGLKITSSGNSSYPYQFSFTEIMTSAQTANVSAVQGLDANGKNIATTYSGGVAMFASSPAKVTYNYATAYKSTKMGVTLTAASGSSPNGIPIDAEHFPDAKFRNVINGYDNNKDGTLSESEAKSVTKLDVYNKGITSLKGVEYFTALTVLWCNNNQLTALDLSKNTALTALYCHQNQLTALDVSKNTALTELDCQWNQLTELDLSKNTALTVLICYNNQLTAFDVSKNTALTTLHCHANQLTALDVSKNTALMDLNCGNNQLTVLDLSKNTALRWLDCGNNQLTELDVSKNTALTYLSCKMQTASGLKITSSGNSSYPYQFSFTEIMTSAQTANVSDVQGLDTDGKNIATTYSDGVAMFASSPAKVTYNYTTAYKSTKMDVTLTEGTSPTPTPTPTPASTKPAITTTALPNGTTNTAYSQTLTATGTTPITWTLSAGTLPTGLTLDSDGTISGTPTKAGTYKFTAKAQNSAGNSTKKFTVKITNPSDWSAPKITTSSLTPGTVGKEYLLQLEASGTPAPTFRITSGKLPAGLSLDSDGTISGTPTKSGSFKFTVRAENSVGYHQKQFTLKVLIMPAITTESLKAATVGTSYSASLTASGSTPITWTLSGDLPNGLKFTNGKLTGKPTENGTFTFTVTASNSAGEDTKTFSLDVHAVLPVFATTSLPVGTWGKKYSAKITMRRGTKPITLSMSGNLPEGLEFDSDTWTISGTPKETCTDEPLTFTAENAEGSTEKIFTLTVNGAAPKIKTPSITPAVKGNEYSLQLEATGSPTITWSAVNLPEGLSIDSETGEISGTPTEEGTFKFTVTASNGKSAKKTLTLTVAAIPEITDDIISEGDAEESYKYTLEYTGTSPVKFTLSEGSLPNGLKLSSAGKISGTPKESGEFTFTVTASNSGGSSSKEITIIINAAPPRITGTLKTGKTGAEYSSGLKINSGSLPVEWSCEGDLPAGLEFDSDTGNISGTPEEAYSGYIVVKAENSGGVHKKKVRLLIREDKNAEKSSLPEERKDTAQTEKSSLPEEITADVKPDLTEKITGRIYRAPSSNTAIHVHDGLMIAAELGEISCDVQGMYDVAAEISGDIPIGAELVYIANSDEPSSDDDIAEFFDDEGNEISIVPESRKIIVSIWLHPERTYNPVIAVKR